MMASIGLWIFVWLIALTVVVGVWTYLCGRAQQQRHERDAARMRRYLDARDQDRAAREREMLARELTDDGVDRR